MVSKKSEELKQVKTLPGDSEGTLICSRENFAVFGQILKEVLDNKQVWEFRLQMRLLGDLPSR